MSFLAWLRGQRRRSDAIGDLGREAALDRCAPPTYREMKKYLLGLRVPPEAIRALKYAGKEYRRFRLACRLQAQAATGTAAQPSDSTAPGGLPS